MSIHSDIQTSVILTAVLVVLVLVFVSLRVFVRLAVVRSFSWDDGLLIAAAVSFTIMISLGWKGNSLGDINKATAAEYELYMKLFMVEVIFWMVCTTCLKLSISIFLLRLAVKRIHRIIIYAIALIYVLASVSFTIVLLIYCRPIAYYWDKTIEGGTCMSKKSFYTTVMTNGVFGSITDFGLSALPAWMVWDIQMEKKTKISICFILSLGLLSSAATIVRLCYLHPLVYSSTFTSQTIDFANWSSIEPAMGIIAASLVSVRALARYIADKLGVTFWSSKGYKGGTATTAGPKMSWKKPNKDGYIKSTTSGEQPIRMDDLILRPEQVNKANKLGAAVTITSPSGPAPLTGFGKSWDIQRTDQWSISDRSVGSTQSAKQPDLKEHV